jgi:hypothetical protein
MTGGAERDQIFALIISKSAARADVMHLEIDRAAAVLASPPVPLEHLSSKFVVCFSIESQARPPWAQQGHEAFCSPWRKLIFIPWGSSWNIRLIESNKASSLLS